ncbi:MAG: hypothetical protein O3C21_15365 [Verrucomicrobia bacterium]|nr:hypothetical protein [Verrucomicrobiota bacterium]
MKNTSNPPAADTQRALGLALMKAITDRAKEAPSDKFWQVDWHPIAQVTHIAPVFPATGSNPVGSDWEILTFANSQSDAALFASLCGILRQR